MIQPWSGNPIAGTHGVFEVIQSASGSDTVTWGTNYIANGGTASITLSTTAGAKDYLSYVINPAGQTVISLGAKNAVH